MTGSELLRANAAQLRLTAAGVIAAVLATLTLSPIFTGNDWLRESLLAIAVVAVVGAGGRLARIPRVPVVVLQLVGLAMLETARFAPTDAYLGFIPSTASIEALVDLANAGATSINQQTVPVLDVPGIALIVALGIGLAAVEIDLTAVACRCPAISGVVLLAVYGVSIAVLPGGASWWWFAVGAAGWLLLLYVGRREAVHEWGDTVTEGGTNRFGDGTPRAALGWQIGVGAVLAGVVFAGLAPGVGDGVVGRITGIGDGDGGDSSSANSVRLNLTATIQRNLQRDGDTSLLRYQTSNSSPQYLRLAVLDRFEGVAWQPALLPVGAPSTAEGPQPIRGIGSSLRGVDQLTTVVDSFGAARDLAYLPAPYTPVQVDGIGKEWVWDTTTSTVFSRSSRLDAASYTVDSQYVTPVASRLASQNGAELADQYDTAIPEGLPPSVTSLAGAAVGGATTDYAKAVRLQSWFRGAFRYSLDAPPTDSANAIDAFLTSRVGYCQQFAATYALMARTLGLASRVVVGFTPGAANADGSYTVGTKDYHAWPEVWFDDAGWVRFEPTPRDGDGSRVDVPAWSLPNAFAPQNAEQPAATPSAAPAPSASSAPSRPAVAENSTEVTAATSWTERLRPLGILALVVLVGLLALAPGVARERRRRRRLTASERPATVESIEDAWEELADTARDLGVPWVEDDTPRRTADALVDSAGLEGRAATAVQNLRRDVELARYAGGPAATTPARGPADAVRVVRRSMMATTSRSDRLRARLLPRTMFRRRG